MYTAVFVVGWLGSGLAGAVIMHLGLSRWLSWYTSNPKYTVSYDGVNVALIFVAVLFGPFGLFGAAVNFLIWAPGDETDDEEAQLPPRRAWPLEPAIVYDPSTWTGRQR